MMVGIPHLRSRAGAATTTSSSPRAPSTRRCAASSTSPSWRQRIEIRVVLHKQTAPALVEIAEFIARNLPFVDQVALMGLEMIGLARANIAELWIDPTDYAETSCVEAVTLLDRSGIHTMIYNHQLCLIDASSGRSRSARSATGRTSTTPSARPAPSRSECGGFFFSAKYKVTEKIRAIPAETKSTVAPTLLSL